MICYSPITYDTVARAYSFLADCEDEFPTVRGVDGLPAFASKRYGVYRAVEPAEPAWLGDRTGDVFDTRDDADDAAESDCALSDVAWDDDAAAYGDDAGVEAAYDNADVTAEVSTFRAEEAEPAPCAAGARSRRVVIVEIERRVPAPTAALAALEAACDEAGEWGAAPPARDEAPSRDEALPKRIGVRRARHLAH